MLRSVLKEGFRGGRAATVENLTEQFCQKVELIQLFLSQAHDQPMWSSFFTGHKSLQRQGGANTPAKEGEGEVEGGRQGRLGGEGHL